MFGARDLKFLLVELVGPGGKSCVTSSRRVVDNILHALRARPTSNQVAVDAPSVSVALRNRTGSEFQRSLAAANLFKVLAKEDTDRALDYLQYINEAVADPLYLVPHAVSKHPSLHDEDNQMFFSGAALLPKSRVEKALSASDDDDFAAKLLTVIEFNKLLGEKP